MMEATRATAAMRWACSGGKARRKASLVLGAFGSVMLAILVLKVHHGDAQPAKYMHGAAWKTFLSKGQEEPNWFSRWNTMVQPRIDQFAALVEDEWESQERGDEEKRPYLVTMVGDSTMMMQHGVMCAFLGERSGRRFDPAVHQEECCIDTPPKKRSTNSADRPAISNNSSSSTIGDRNDAQNGPGFAIEEREEGGGRGLCFRHAFQRYSAPPDQKALGSPHAVYFGNGLHFLHMCHPRHGLEPIRVQGWLTYEKDLEDAVTYYRSRGDKNFRLIFMASHSVEETMYEGDFLEVIEAYRRGSGDLVDLCENKMSKMAGGKTGPEGYGPDDYCKKAVMNRHGSDILNRRSRPVMEKMGVPFVRGDMIVRDQAWATTKQDGRHYHMLVPDEVWELLGVLAYPDAFVPSCSSPGSD